MLYRLVRPVKRRDSSLIQFTQRIPADVHSRANGLKLAIPLSDDEFHHLTISAKAQAIRLSLRTRDPSEAKIRQGRVASYLEEVWRGLRATKPLSLTHRQATALAGDLYRAWASETQRERTLAIVHTPDGWKRDYSEPAIELAGFKALVSKIESEAVNLERALGPLVSRLLLARGIASVDELSRALLLDAFALALKDAFAFRARNLEGDYSPDPKANRFPPWSLSETQSANPANNLPAKVSLKALVEDWWKEAKATGRKPSTYDSYRNTMASLVAFLEHDDATQVSPDDVIRFKDHRLSCLHPRTGKPISAKTVKDSDLAGLKTVFGWAVGNRKISANPAAGITIKIGKAPKLRSKGFTDAEAKAILEVASAITLPVRPTPTEAAKRWVPWLCCYTGARVGEMAQLRQQDIRREGEHWVVTITPEAGTVKTNEARQVVLHPHLVEQGFPDFVAASSKGHLFLRPSKDGTVLGPLRGLKNRLAEFARAIVTDPNVAPNHGWRHRFKTVGMEAGIPPRVLDAIQGQAPASIADTYGDVTIKTLAAAIEKIPVLEIPNSQ
ncbi:MAG: recombinase XerD [Hyphomicrobiales bacterium]|nr:MAG: recombinase XerD [Hyphomicrobiales bacterium]